MHDSYSNLYIPPTNKAHIYTFVSTYQVHGQQTSRTLTSNTHDTWVQARVADIRGPRGGCDDVGVEGLPRPLRPEPQVRVRVQVKLLA